MFEKISAVAEKVKQKAVTKMIDIQTNMICNDGGLKSPTGMKFLAGCLAVSSTLAPTFASSTSTTTTNADDIAGKIKTSVGNVYGAMKTIGVVVAACGVALSAFYLFTGGDKGMEKAKKTILYTVLGCGILFLAVPIVNFMASLFSGSSNEFKDLTSYTSSSSTATTGSST